MANSFNTRVTERTKFAKGLQAGMLMAKQHRGILLLMAGVMRNTGGSQLPKGKDCFNAEKKANDWILLVETMLEWKHWLCSERMDHTVVCHMKGKIKFIMQLLKKIADRKTEKNNGWNMPKFHNILHVWEDILMFGIPLEFDTGSTESGHKITKTAAKTTQRNQETFDLQTAERLVEHRVVDMAMEELNGRPLWEHHDGFSHPVLPE